MMRTKQVHRNIHFLYMCRRPFKSRCASSRGNRREDTVATRDTKPSIIMATKKYKTAAKAGTAHNMQTEL